VSVAPPDPTIPSFYLYPSNDFDVEITDIRVHAIAIYRWLNRIIRIREGMPVPVLFTGPMDAFSQFNRLWSTPDNPYAYLKELQEYGCLDEPAQLRFPIISLDFKRMRYRPEQSYSTRVNRHAYWPTIDSVQQGLRLNDLANIAVVHMPSAWNFVYQLDFWCSRPDTQAFFIKQFTNATKASSGGQIQTYIPVVYPGYYGFRVERIFLASDIEDMTDKAPENTEIQFRTSLTLELEGYAVPQMRTITPTVWNVFQTVGVNPADVDRVYQLSLGVPSTNPVPSYLTTITKATGAVLNPIVIARSDTMPPVAGDFTTEFTSEFTTGFI
jgi:hypothetical protein